MHKHTHTLWQPKSRLLIGLVLICAVALAGSWSAMTAVVPATEAAQGSRLQADTRLNATNGVNGSSFSQSGGGAG